MKETLVVGHVSRKGRIGENPISQKKKKELRRKEGLCNS